MRKKTSSGVDRKAFFNQAAGSWDEQFLNKDFTDLLKMLVPKFNLARGQKILDVGTGTGVLIPYLVQAVGPSGFVVAVDFAEKMVETCKRKFAGFHNVRVELQNVEELDFPLGYFDVVTCFGLFPHIENKRKALLRINRVLKPMGRLVVAHALSSDEIRKLHQETFSLVADDVMPDAMEMKRLFEQAGFIVENIEDRPGCYLCQSSKVFAVCADKD
jgi:demethylmenaquinone methyltransferase/2-methoxy-6-polyprenyl-1,4-benzoquinol methylase